MDIPEINIRIKQLVEHYANGKVARFAVIIGVKQQTVNRLFNIDTRTGKYPIVTTEVLVAITEMLVNVSIEWLITGRGNMLREEKPAQAEKSTIIQNDPKDAEIIALLKDKIRLLEEKIASHSMGLDIARCADTLSIPGKKITHD